MGRLKRLGLGTYLALMIGSLIVTLTVVLVAIVEWRISADIKQVIGRELAELAFQTTDKLDRGLFERYREVQLLAERSLLADPQVAPDGKREQLELMQKTYPTYAWIGVTDGHGRVQVATGGLLEGVDVSLRPWFGDALKGTYLHDVHEAVSLATLLPRNGSELQRFVDVAFPYRDAAGQVAGVLATHLSWQWAREVQASVLRPQDGRGKLDAVIVSNKGSVLLGPAELMGKRLALASVDASLKNKSGYTVETWADGKRYLVGYSRTQGYLSYPGLGWTVLVRQEVGEAYRPAAKLQRTILLIGLSAALLFALIGYQAARAITAPVREIARVAAALESGEVRSMKLQINQYREIASLAGTLNALMRKLAHKESRLRKMNLSLEERVRERTGELATAVHALELDQAERARAELALRASEQRLRTITDNMPAAILYVDREQRFRFANQTFLRWRGYTRDTLLGKTLADVLVERGGSYAEIEAHVRRALAGERAVFEVERMIEGSAGHVEQTYIPDVYDGQVAGFYVMVQDITDRKNAQEYFEHHATHDALTGLPNRRSFMERLALAMARSERNLRPLAVMFLDLNKFKAINDTLGHGAGDVVLTRFGSTLTHCVRKTDTVARLAGDEFIILAEELFGGEDDALIVAHKIVAALEAQAPLSAELGQLATSIGIAILRPGDSPEELVARADRAMYAAKELGGNRWSIG
jgi:diguanylate cyclase (GGDEF)-like protein/PAS domain S-box-containing protein